MYFDVCRGPGTNSPLRTSNDYIDKEPLSQYRKTEGIMGKMMLRLPTEEFLKKSSEESRGDRKSAIVMTFVSVKARNGAVCI